MIFAKSLEPLGQWPANGCGQGHRVLLSTWGDVHIIWQDLHQFPDISCMMRPCHFAKHATRMYQARLRTNHPIITDRISVQNTMGKRVSNDMAATGSYLADLVKHRDITHGWWCSNMFQWNAHETTIHQSKWGSSFSSFWMIYDPCAWRWWPLGALTTTYDILLHMIYIYIHMWHHMCMFFSLQKWL